MSDERGDEPDGFGAFVPMGSAGPAWTSAASVSERHVGKTAGDASPAVAGLVAAVDTVLRQVPADLPEAQALTDASVLLGQVERLRIGLLGRIADVEHRKLFVLDGAGSTSSWVEQQQTSLDRGEVALARRMSSLLTLQEAVRSGGLSVAVAERVGKALATLRRYVDRPDGLIDGQDGEQALVGVIGHGIQALVLQAWGGLADDDPRLTELLAGLADIVARPSSQLARLEAGFVLLAQHLEAQQLPGALGQLVDALLPNELEKRAEGGHARRGFGLRLNEDGSGWIITDRDLDLECGELLQAVLQVELAVDPDAPVDTAAYGQLREQGWQDGDPLPEGGDADGVQAHGGNTPHGPRSLRQKRHDALKNGLRRYLDAGIAGLREKVTPHVAVAVGVDLLEQHPGALPAFSTTSGARLPLSLVRRWTCDSAVARFVLSLGGRVIETSHSERTLKPHERRIKKLETGGRCQIGGCRCGPGSPGAHRLVPHHPDAWATTGRTSLGDTAWICEQHHHDLHTGKKTLRLRDGRWLHEDGWRDGPCR